MWNLVLTVVAWSSAANWAMAERVVLHDASGPRFSIAVVAAASTEEKAAAEELREYLSRITGSPFAVHTLAEKSGPVILVARADHSPEDNAGQLGSDAFLIDVAAERIRLVGGDDQGVRYAATTFLEDLGVRWILPGEFGEVVPKNADLSAEAGRRTERPDFEFRQIWYSYGAQSPEGAQRLAQWCQRNKVGGITIAHGHNLTASLPAEMTLETHPQYYALVDGKRQKTQVCTTHPEVIRLITAKVNAYFDANPEKLTYSLCPDDNTQFCECQRCQALDVGGIDEFTGKPIVSDRYMRFMNEVARGIQPKHPGKMVTTYAYVNYTDPPQQVEVDPHVAVVFTTSVFCSIHGIGDDHCASRMRMRRLLEAWRTKTPRVYIYEYDPVPFNAELPCPLFGARIREMPVYRALGIRGFTFESHQSWGTLWPNHYVSARLMWDADQDGSALLRDACQAFFGPAADAMLAYYTALESAFGQYHGEIGWSLRDMPDAFSQQALSRMEAAIDGAQRAAGQEPYRRRVAMVRSGFDYLREYLAVRAAAIQGTHAEYRAHLDKAEALISSMARANEDFILEKVAKEYLRKLDDEVPTPPPADMGLVTSWWLIGPFDNAGTAGHAREFGPEKKIDLGAAYPAAAAERKWFRHDAPPWRGTVDLAAIMRPKDWGCAYALTYVTSPVARDVQLRLGSNDSVVVFLNGSKVHDNKASRRLSIDADIVPARLEAGRNTVLLKVCQSKLNWGFAFRITSLDGKPVEGLRYSLGP